MRKKERKKIKKKKEKKRKKRKKNEKKEKKSGGGVNAAYSMLMGQPVTSLEKCRVAFCRLLEISTTHGKHKKSNKDKQKQQQKYMCSQSYTTTTTTTAAAAAKRSQWSELSMGVRGASGKKEEKNTY